MNIFKLELKRAIFNKRMLIVLLFGVVLMLYNNITSLINELDYYNYIIQENLTDGADISSLYFRWFGMGLSEEEIIFFYVFPLLAVYPAGMIYFDDRKNGYLKNLYTQCSKVKCLFGKYFATFISGGVAVSTPLVLSFMIAALYSPARMTDSIVNSTIGDNSLWSGLFYSHPLLYVVAYILLDFVFGGLFACLAMSLSDILSHKFTVFMSSFIFVVVLDFVCQQLGKYELQPDMFLPPAQYNSIGGIELFIMVSILFLFTILTFIIGGLRSETY